MHFHYFKSSCALKKLFPSSLSHLLLQIKIEFSEFNLKVSALENCQDQGQIFYSLYLPPGVPLVHMKTLSIYKIPEKVLTLCLAPQPPSKLCPCADVLWPWQVDKTVCNGFLLEKMGVRDEKTTGSVFFWNSSWTSVANKVNRDTRCQISRVCWVQQYLWRTAISDVMLT